jgi:polysaccharide export outer membrane protein
MRFIILFFILAVAQPLSAAQGNTPWLTPDEVELLEHPYRKDVKIESYYNLPDSAAEAKAKKDQDDKPIRGEEDATRKLENVPYRLRIGDVLLVNLYGSSDLKGSSNPSIVDGTGNIIIPFVGTFYALGKTIDEFRKDMTEKTKNEFPNSLVSVTPYLLTGNQYTILGEVSAPGTWTTTGSTTVLSAIAQAGGFPIRNLNYYVIDYADLDKAFLIRNGKYIPVDFKKLIRDGDTSQDVLLKGGDFIYIPNFIIKEVYVLGNVLRPIVYTFVETATLIETLSYAGGLGPDASSRVLVLRGSICHPEVYWIDVNLISRGAAPDFMIVPGDIVYVPTMKFKTFRDIVRLGISAFVNQMFTTAGQNAFVQLVPAASGFNFSNNNSGIIFTPVTAVTAP